MTGFMIWKIKAPFFIIILTHIQLHDIFLRPFPMKLHKLYYELVLFGIAPEIQTHCEIDFVTTLIAVGHESI